MTSQFFIEISFRFSLNKYGYCGDLDRSINGSQGASQVTNNFIYKISNQKVINFWSK